MSAMFVERGGDVESAVTPRPIGLHSSTGDGVSSAVINNTLGPMSLSMEGGDGVSMGLIPSASTAVDELLVTGDVHQSSSENTTSTLTENDDSHRASASSTPPPPPTDNNNIEEERRVCTASINNDTANNSCGQSALVYESLAAIHSRRVGKIDAARSGERKRKRSTGSEKIECTLNCSDAIDTISSLLGDTIAYIKQAQSENDSSPEVDLNQIVEVLRFCDTGLRGQTSKIRKALDNTNARKSSTHSHAILSRERRREERTQQQKVAMLLKRDRSKMLEESLNRTKQIISNISNEGTESELGGGSLPTVESPQEKRQRQDPEASSPSQQVEDSNVDDVGQPKDDDDDDIILPKPMDGQMYNPTEAAVAYYEISQDVQTLTNTDHTKKKIHKSYLKRVKEKMIRTGYVPVQISALNNLIKDHGAPGQPIARLSWNERGRPPVVDIGIVVERFKKQQEERPGQGWTRENTRKLLVESSQKQAEQRGTDPSSVSEPCQKTVNAYHSALQSVAFVSQRKAQSKSLHRAVGETSVRNMLSTAAGLISAIFYVDENNTTPPNLKFDESKATEGAKLARQIYADAVGVPVGCIQALPSSLMSNIDDMACTYDSSSPTSAEDEVVLVDRRLTDSNRSYGVHTDSAPTKVFNGVKARPTTMITPDGKMAPLWIQYPNFSEAEMPKDKTPKGVIVIEVEGLEPNGNISTTSTGKGYVVLLRSGPGVEIEMFRLYEELVRQPTINLLRKRMGLPTTDVPAYAGALTTLDGGMTQLTATESYLEDKVNRNETQLKLAKNTSAVSAPCDNGKGHQLRRHFTKTLTPEQVPTVGVVEKMEQSLRELQDSGVINLAAAKRDNIIGSAGRSCTAVHLAYNERTIFEAFVNTGMTDASRQSVDVLVVMNQQLKRAITITERKKWIEDLPQLVKEMIQYGHIRENDSVDIFTELGYPEDSDESGNEYPLPRSFATQHHRQRCTIMTSENVRKQILQKHVNSVAAALTNVEVDRATEIRWREGVLERNAVFERALVANLDECSNSSHLQDENIDIDASCFPQMHSRFVTGFVQARLMDNSKSKSFSKSINVGNVKDLTALIEKLEGEEPYQLDPSKDKTLYYLAYQLCKKPVKLKKLDEAASTDDGTDRVDTEEESGSAPSAVESAISRNVIVQPSNGLAIREARRHPILDNGPLLEEARAAIYGCKLASTITQSAREQIDILVRKIPNRLQHLKQSSTQVDTLQHHWAMNAFEENIHSICQLIGLAGYIRKNIGTVAGPFEALLRPPGIGQGAYPKVDVDANALKSKQGVGLYYNGDAAFFCHVYSVHGTETNTLGNQYDEDKKMSARQTLQSTEFARKYPRVPPPSAHLAGWDGTFGELDFFAPFAFDPKADNDCLIRKDGGLFVWSDITLKKLQESKISNDLKSKKLIFISCMFQLMYSLMMDTNKSIPIKALQPFMPVGV